MQNLPYMFTFTKILKILFNRTPHIKSIMKTFLKPLLSVVIAGILFYACSASNGSYLDQAKNNLDKKDYQQALAYADSATMADTSNAQAFYYKGYILSKLADSQSNPANRTTYYKKMHDAFAKAQKLFSNEKGQDKDQVLMRMDIVNHWTREHNSAIRLVTNDSSRPSNYLEQAIAHLKNATTISPDSLISWQVLGEVYIMNKNYDGAENAMQKVIDNNPKADTTVYLRLAAIYEQGKKIQNSIDVLKKGHNQYPQNISIVQQLANAYLNADQDQHAIEVVKSLIQNDPNNPQYHLVYGTEIYKMALVLNDSLQSNFSKVFDYKQKLHGGKVAKAEQKSIQHNIDSVMSVNERLQTKIDTLGNRAEVQLKRTISLRPKDATAYHTIGVIYQNKAAAFFQMRNITDNIQKSNQYDKQAKDMLQKSLPYYEKAAQIEPNNKSYWQSLFRVYTNLGMTQKAKEAMQKAGMGSN